jgi:hypothetical protein
LEESVPAGTWNLTRGKKSGNKFARWPEKFPARWLKKSPNDF